MSGWPIVSLGSVVKFVSGGTPSKEDQRYWTGDIPWVSSAEMKQRWISDTQLHVSEDGAKVGSRLIPKNTVLAVVRGMSLAKEFRVSITTREMTFNQDLKALLPSDTLSPVYLFYYLLSQNNAIRDSASEAAHGTKKLDMPVLEQWPIPIPPLAIQQKIAAILSAYDDLIANNQRRITLLERMAEDIYREWFVRLRFPGHADVKIEKGVPQGWGFVALSEIASINASSLKKGSERDRIQYIDISAVTTNHIGDLSEIALADAPGRARRLVKHGDVIWSSVRPANRAYCLIYEPPKNLVASTGFAVISPKPEVPFTFINFAVTSDSFVEQMAMVAKGAAYPATSFDDFGKALVLRPSADLLERFHVQCEPMFKRRHQLRRTNAALAQQRDALLPCLISGKLSVDALDIHFPPGMGQAE
jgi:type I restriction enzyme, S subunit